jgi:murein DD-endopeptidase
MIVLNRPHQLRATSPAGRCATFPLRRIRPLLGPHCSDTIVKPPRRRMIGAPGRLPAAWCLAVLCLTAICGLFESTVGLAQSSSLHQSFDLRVPWPPMPVVVDGKKLLVYELHITNFASADLALRRIEVFDSSGAMLGDFRDTALTGIIGRFDHNGTATDPLQIPSGVRAIAYLSVPIDIRGATSITASHRVEYEAPGTSNRAAVEGGAFTANMERISSIGPPLRGGPWVAIYDASWKRGHRRVPYAVEGSVHIPGRFAIDWIKVDKSGKYFDGNGSNVKDWYGYGAEVLAVADGVVTATRDGVPESSTLLKRSEPSQPEEASGNYIALNLGAGHFAFYEHLKPDSIRVKNGNHVRRGEVIALLGYTGESTGPHLHFHIGDHDSPLNAEGLPYLLEGFKVLGRYDSIEAFGKSTPWSAVPARNNLPPGGEFPAPLVVVDFPHSSYQHSPDNSSQLQRTE